MRGGAWARPLGHLVIAVLLTLVTQIGGVAWLMSRLMPRPVLSFVVLYTGLSVATVFIAPVFGRVPLDCAPRGELQMQSRLYCALNRHYVTPELALVLQDMAEGMQARYPGTITLVLDANFPFLTGFPLLPHLSHDDGEKADLAFYYRDEAGYLPGQTRSPIGYFAFEPGPTDCPPAWPSLRWDMGWVQPLWRDYALDAPRLRSALQMLGEDARVGRIFVEPHLVTRLGAAHPRIGFQGCRAARHDDHIHLQLR